MTRRDEVVHSNECGRNIVGRGRFQYREAHLERRAAQRRLHLLAVDRTTADRERLIEQRQRVACRAAGAAGDEVEGFGIGLDPFLGQDVGEELDQLPVRQQCELEVLRARPEGGQDLLRVGRGEDEHHVCGRFFERLQQRVRRRRGEHVHLVDDVHLALARRADAEVHALDELAHGVDAVVRGRVQLDQVEEGAVRDRDAVLTGAVGLPVGLQVQAVEGAGQDPGGRGLAGAAGAGEEVGMADAVVSDRAPQRVGDVLLADEFRELLRPVLAVQALRRHGRNLTDAH